MNVFARHSRRVAQLFKRFAYFFLPPALLSPRELLPRFVQKNTRKQLIQAIKRRFNPAAEDFDPHALTADTEATLFTDRCRGAYWFAEDDIAAVKKKMGLYRELLSHRIDRVRLYREIGRLERLQGSDLTAAVYAVRAMRLLGGDRFGDLSWSVEVLDQNGFTHEAQAIDAMYGPHADRQARCRRLLDAAYRRCQTLPPPCEFAIRDDQRGDSRPRVAIVVSLYNAAGKMAVFLEALRRQTLLRDRQIEVIFVDSASPINEHAAVRDCASVRTIPYLFVRTRERESIQTAWNRGIALTRAPYLAFLGVDETVMPTAYEELAAELDAHAEIDWVMADSLVTEVDARGNPGRDAMPYDRQGYTQDHVQLETCYLSWVGGLYRRSIHERFGYYDGSYRAAGDTEFKGRILPHVRSKHLPRMLGVFLNYPEERTTASPRAELEDMRAWYLHRSAGGIDYAFGKRTPADLEAMILRSLGYRKSYCWHWSSDCDYASAALEVLRQMSPASPVLGLAGSVNRLLDAYRVLDCLPTTSAAAIEKAITAVHQVSIDLKMVLKGLPEPPPVNESIFHDNRFEQHTHPW